jgi:cysteine synthase A
MNTGTVWDLVGNTPLVKIESLSKLTGCLIYGKAEYLNPTGSVKDRAAKAIIQQGEIDGLLKPGFTIVEGTAGNTGIGIAGLAISRGYKALIVMPNNQAIEKVQLLKALGAEVRLVDPCPFSNPNHFYHQARTLSESTPRSFWANQFENLANAKTHLETTGPEIWQQTERQIDAFTCAAGTGGTISGVSQFLKAQKKDIFIQLVDPTGSALFSYIKTGQLVAQGSSVTEGIGIARLTANFKTAQIDDVVQIDDNRMISMLFHLAEKDGLFVGTSAALNCCSALDLGMKWKNSGKTIVTVLCDSGSRYQSKLLNPHWLKEKNLIISKEII